MMNDPLIRPYKNKEVETTMRLREQIWYLVHTNQYPIDAFHKACRAVNWAVAKQYPQAPY